MRVSLIGKYAQKVATERYFSLPPLFAIASGYVMIFQAHRKHRRPIGIKTTNTQHAIPRQPTIIAHGSLIQSHITAESSAPVMWYPIHSNMVKIAK